MSFVYNEASPTMHKSYPFSFQISRDKIKQIFVNQNLQIF